MFNNSILFSLFISFMILKCNGKSSSDHTSNQLLTISKIWWQRSCVGFPPYFYFFLSWVTQQRWGLGLPSVHNALSLLLLPPHTLPLIHSGVTPTGYSTSRPVLMWVLLMGCSSSGTAQDLHMGYSPTRNWLLQCSSSTCCRLQFLPENLLLCGLFSMSYSHVQ